jgi:DNA-binding transcriptional regulator YiaG
MSTRLPGSSLAPIAISAQPQYASRQHTEDNASGLAAVEPGRKQVLSVEDWAEIRRLRRAEGLSVSAIARLLGVSRNTVSSALAASEAS